MSMRLSLLDHDSIASSRQSFIYVSPLKYHKALQIVCVVFALGGGIGCQNKTPSLPPSIKPPTTYPHASAQHAIKNEEWWDKFNDPQLAFLIKETAARNLDIAIARSKSESATAAIQASNSAILPRLTASLSKFNEKTQYDDSIKRFGLFDKSGEKITAEFNWEIDLFGSNRDIKHAVLKQFEASEWGIYAAQILATQASAKQYFEWQAWSTKHILLTQILKSQQQSLDAALKREHVGMANSIEINQYKAAIEDTLASLTQIDTAILNAERELTLLTKQRPTLHVNTALFDHVWINEDIATGQPADLLLRRPDLRIKELLLQSETLKLKAAEKNRLPKLFLNAIIGRQNLSLSPFSVPLDPTRLSNVAAAFAWPIFDPRIKAQILASKASLKTQFLEYEKDTLNALTQVDSLLRLKQLEKERLAAQATVLDYRKNSFKRMQSLFDVGQINRLQLEDARRAVLASQLNVLDTQHQLAKSTIDLYTALGGAWVDNPESAPKPSTLITSSAPATPPQGQ